MGEQKRMSVTVKIQDIFLSGAKTHFGALWL